MEVHVAPSHRTFFVPNTKKSALFHVVFFDEAALTMLLNKESPVPQMITVCYW